MVRRTKEDAMETRAKLLDAAEALFSENGVTHTSMMQVAEKAGVTRGDPQVRSLASILLHKCEYIDEVNPIKLRHVSGRNECICDIEKLFESAIERGELATTVDARIAVIGLFSLVDGLIYNWLLAPDYFPLVEYGNQAIDSYINGLTR